MTTISPRDRLIGDRRIGPGHPVYITAEIGLNHNGEVSTALALVDVPPGSFSDFDSDGLDDSWELTFLGGSLDENGANDHDGDLFSNRAELLAGTDPSNAASKPPGSASWRAACPRTRTSGPG